MGEKFRIGKAEGARLTAAQARLTFDADAVNFCFPTDRVDRNRPHRTEPDAQAAARAFFRVHFWLGLEKIRRGAIGLKRSVIGRRRIARHRAARRERGFETIENYVNLSSLEIPEGANALLEDLGNLAANELFRPDGDIRTVVPGIEHLLALCRHLTVVTNEVFSGGKDYEGETLRYLRELAQINRALAARADRVVEGVCGLPNLLKGESL